MQTDARTEARQGSARHAAVCVCVCDADARTHVQTDERYLTTSRSRSVSARHGTTAKPGQPSLALLGTARLRWLWLGTLRSTRPGSTRRGKTLGSARLGSARGDDGWPEPARHSLKKKRKNRNYKNEINAQAGVVTISLTSPPLVEVKQGVMIHHHLLAQRSPD